MLQGLTLVAVFISVSSMIIGMYRLIFRNRITVENRLAEVTLAATTRKTYDEEKLSQPFSERVIRPILESLARRTAKALPAKKQVSLERKLMMAGNPGNLTANEFLVIHYSVTILLPILVGIIMIPTENSAFNILLSMVLTGVAGMMLPEYYLQMKSRKRQESIQKELPDVLDLLTVSVEAGLGFDAALAKVVEKFKGVLAEEFARLLQEIKMGKPRREALRDVAQKNAVEDLQSFIGAIIQADQLGVSIGNVLRTQSGQMRQRRRQIAEEKAMKAPVKMLIPMVLFIFPTLFIVLLGPALINIIDSF